MQRRQQQQLLLQWRHLAQEVAGCNEQAAGLMMPLQEAQLQLPVLPQEQAAGAVGIALVAAQGAHACPALRSWALRKRQRQLLRGGGSRAAPWAA